MKNQEQIQELLNEVQQTVGDSFAAQTDAIFAAYLAKNGEKSTLAIKILSILGGFLGMITFVAFLLLAGLYDSEVGMLAFGLVFIGGAIIINKLYDRLLTDTASISSYITGFFLLAFGFAALQVEENTVALICLAIALLTLFITQAYMLSFIAVLVINGAILFLILQSEILGLINVYVALLVCLLTLLITQEARLITSSKILNKLYEPTKIALILVALYTAGMVNKSGLFFKEIELMWLPSLASFICILYVIYLITNILKISNPTHKILIFLASILILSLTIFASTISCAMLVILLCFLTNYKTGFAIGIIAFIYAIGQYYYDLNLTLLTKSIILMVSGVLFLVFYYLISITYTRKS
jgi:uncharacterized membrane protein